MLNKKHLGSKRVQGQSEAGLQTGWCNQKLFISADSEAKKLFYQKYSNDICSIFLQVRMIGFVTWPL